MKFFTRILSLMMFAALVVSGIVSKASTDNSPTYWLKVAAQNKYDRTAIAQTGASIEISSDGFVIATGSQRTRDLLSKQGVLLSSFEMRTDLFDFPQEDSNFHNYDRTHQFLVDLVTKYPNLATLDSIGKSLEGRELYRIRIGSDQKTPATHPGIVFMGGHHAREHVAVEVPLLLAQYLLEHYATDANVKTLVDSRDIHIIPLVNPDGAEYDIADGSYKMWRKNRSHNADGTLGVDLNRNYGYEWGTGGSSTSGDDETYMGPSAFSEPETQAVRDFVNANSNITILLSFHTYSQLILYPWGHTYESISDAKDQAVFQKMATTMAQWNGYTPEQSSALYIASGDTTDWAYGTKKIFAFTFELDPDGNNMNGFYPGEAAIPTVFNKNVQPCLYLLGLADNPYRATNTVSNDFGLTSNLLH